MRRLLLAAVLFVTVSHPARAQFCPGAAPWVFDDVPAADLFCGYITWAAQNGITLGCAIIDANHRLYCPNDGVTRSQMAAFVNRLGNVRVEAVGTGPGLTGGPITSVGTINLATTQLLPTTACASNQIARWNGSAWACSTDANSGGTVTSVASGTGLAGGPITSTGTLSIATAYQLPQSCTNGQVPKSNGTGGWTCASDAIGTGTVTSITAGAGLTGGTITGAGTITADTSYVQARVSATCPAGSSIRAIAQNGTVTCQTDNAGPANAYVQGGNAFGATAVIGTTDNNAIDVRVNGARAMRYEPNAISPNVIGGSPANSATAGVRGATIAGGGVPAAFKDPDLGDTGNPNRVTDHYGTVGGGWGNRAGDDAGTLSDRAQATVGGGYSNIASGAASTIGGGYSNIASGSDSTIGGGGFNIASGDRATLGGGEGNAVSGAYTSVGGGGGNIASGFGATVPGGEGNVAQGGYSFAAGRRAKALADGVFAFADSTAADFIASTPNSFVGRFSGGYGLWTNNTYTMGCSLAPGGGSWSCVSSRDEKQDFATVDGQSVLQRVAALPISAWRYKTEVSGARHLGPMAQDFHAAFELGDSDKTIGVLDVAGVALAAIQGLNAKVEAQQAEIAALKQALDALLARITPDRQLSAR